MKTSNILITKPSADYELLDSGRGEKLERFGRIILSRPDPQALWGKRLGEKGDDRANVPVRACCSGRSAPSPNAGSLPLLLMIIKLVCVFYVLLYQNIFL